MAAPSLSSAPSLAPRAPVLPSWKTVRNDFPALHQKVHGKPLVYLDNAATAQKPQIVIDTLAHFYEHDNANVHRGLHALSNRATEAYEGARARIARFINAADPAEIIFTRGTTESINLVAASWGGANLKPGDAVLITEMEHHSNMVPWQLITKRTGARLKYVPIVGANVEGGLDLEQLDALLTPDVKLFAFSQVSNTVGNVNPAAMMCAKARAKGILTLVDGAQAIGHMPVDVRAIGCDFYAFSGHKMAGVTGIGALYGRRELLDAMPPYQGGGGMISVVDFQEAKWKPSPERFEAGTPNFADAVALAAACDYLDALGRDVIAKHDADLAKLAYEKLSALPGIRILGPKTSRVGITSFAFQEVHAHDIVTFADEDGIALRGGHHCNQPMMRKIGLTSTTRASFYVYNTPEEIDILVTSLRRILKFFGAS